MTIANNTATTGLGGGLYINSGIGTISYTTITGNAATKAFASGISGGDTQTTLTRSIVTYGTEGNLYERLSCFAQLADGGGNFQFPPKQANGKTDDLKCTNGIALEDPKLEDVADNGCVTWTAKPLAGSPATGSGSHNCAQGNYPPPVVTYADGTIIPRGPYFSASSKLSYSIAFGLVFLFVVILL
eukprot:Phypoly_transcript_22251.p1 GENE.Phypoly_transcript_22251~~Phypoly_transcript_22251.p1  ORF type:complete len:198 (+),score=33.73 Phypoly_transcript_22251:37-594(+)